MRNLKVQKYTGYVQNVSFIWFIGTVRGQGSFGKRGSIDGEQNKRLRTVIYRIFFFYERIACIVRNLLKFLSVSIATSRYRETIVTTILKFQNIYENERRIAVYGDANYAQKGGVSIPMALTIRYVEGKRS